MNSEHLARAAPHFFAASPPPAGSSADWYNLVLLPGGSAARRRSFVPAIVRAEVGRLLGIAESRFARLLGCRAPVPLARLSDPRQADAIRRRLGALGLPLAVLQDASIVARPGEIKQVRRLEITNAGLRLWCRERRGGEAPDEIRSADVVALVRGRLADRKRVRLRRIAAKDRAGVRGEPMDGSAATEAPVLDIFAAAPICTWRIEDASFDYACLGARRKPQPGENFELLVAALRLAASTARFDDAYTEICPLLDPVWASVPSDGADRRRRDARAHGTNAPAWSASGYDDRFTLYARTHAHLERERRRRCPERVAEEVPPADVPCR